MTSKFGTSGSGHNLGSGTSGSNSGSGFTGTSGSTKAEQH
jgi:hypothetical protein